MRYVSTRGDAPVLGFSDVLLAGLASDGGLYLPETFPVLSRDEIVDFAGMPYADVAKRIMTPFIGGEVSDTAFSTMVDEAYATFRHPSVAPLVEIGPSLFVLELFHGPTLAFKDVAMQLLSRLMDHVLAERGRKATIIGATSGDTGGAAIDAFKGRDNTDIFILFPDGRVSDVQRRQMTTLADKNVHALAIDGTFDDAQAIVKGLFASASFRNEVALSGVNSINWARILAQIVYYFTSAVSLGAPHRPVSFTVPTGNFGDIFAGYVAKRMGLPVEKLVIATNRNDILTRALATGRYETDGVAATISPSMDIQVSSNFERLLFEAHGRNPQTVTGMMARLKQSGAFDIEPVALEKIRAEFAAGRTGEDETSAEISAILKDSGYLTDPHTAVGTHVARGHMSGSTPMIVLGTAHPAKFPDAVEQSAGVRPALPDWCADLMEKNETMTAVPNDQKAIEDLIRQRSRAAKSREPA